MCNIRFVILDHPELTRADLAVYVAIGELGPDAFQADIAKMAGLSVRRQLDNQGRPTGPEYCRQVVKSVQKLEAAGLLASDRHHDRAAGKTKTRYLISKTDVHFCAHRSKTNVHGDAHCPGKNGESGPKGGAMCTDMHTMNHDVVDRTKEYFWWIDEPKRSEVACLPKMTPEIARGWESWYTSREYPEWMENPPGWAIKQILGGDGSRRPPQQIPLPEGAVPAGGYEVEDLSEEQHWANIQTLAGIVKIDLGGNGDQARRGRNLYYQFYGSLSLEEIARIAVGEGAADEL